MKFSTIAGAAAGAAALCALVGVATSLAAPPTEAPSEASRYDGQGRLILPADYREWVFVTSGMDMSYSERPAMGDGHMFDNIFAPRAAYRAFLATGAWPDKTVLVMEARGGRTKGSINKRGQFQTDEMMGVEMHVKDTARFKGGWGFFAFDNDQPARQIDYKAACYSCHQAHGAADTTFVQFYPTLLPAARKLGTLSPAYLAEEAAAAKDK
jgi:hypothetical protein